MASDLVSAVGGLRGPRGSGAALFGFGSSALGSSISIANNTTVNPYGTSNTFVGLIRVNDEAPGSGAMFMMGSGTNIVKIAETMANVFTITAGTASRINVYLVAGECIKRLEARAARFQPLLMLF